MMKLYAFIILVVGFYSANLVAEQKTFTSGSDGLRLNYFSKMKISGVVKYADGTPVAAQFYIQDLSKTPPQLIATYNTNADGSYEFHLDMGRWRIVPVSSSYKFEPKSRDYDVSLVAQ
jgi:hypothetical protein